MEASTYAVLLFGVTMAERGVSQLVSVALDEAVKILDQNVA